MEKSKTIHDTRGRAVMCPSFDACPLCFGCRAYDSKYEECRTCEKENKKKNLCKTHLHKSELVAKMIRKEVIVIP